MEELNSIDEDHETELIIESLCTENEGLRNLLNI